MLDIKSSTGTDSCTTVAGMFSGHGEYLPFVKAVSIDGTTVDSWMAQVTSAMEAAVQQRLQEVWLFALGPA